MMTKDPGPGGMRLAPTALDISFEKAFGLRYPDAYERLLMDMVRGNPTLFMRRDEVEAAWTWVEPILEAWAARGDTAAALCRRHLGPDGGDRADRARWADLARGRIGPLPRGAARSFVARIRDSLSDLPPRRGLVRRRTAYLFGCGPHGLRRIRHRGPEIAEKRVMRARMVRRQSRSPGEPSNRSAGSGPASVRRTGCDVMREASCLELISVPARPAPDRPPRPAPMRRRTIPGPGHDLPPMIVGSRRIVPPKSGGASLRQQTQARSRPNPDLCDDMTRSPPINRLAEARLLAAAGRIEDSLGAYAELVGRELMNATLFAEFLAVKSQLIAARSAAELMKLGHDANIVRGRQRLETLLADPAYDDPRRLERHGVKVYSQHDEDGLLREIFRRIGTTTTRSFFEFGVEDGLECNTHLLLHEGWRGAWVEASEQQVQAIRQRFRLAIDAGRLRIATRRVDKDNINDLARELDVPEEPDLVSIDIDFNDYWVFKALTAVRPRVVAVEYNAKFPAPMKHRGGAQSGSRMERHGLLWLLAAIALRPGGAQRVHARGMQHHRGERFFRPLRPLRRALRHPGDGSPSLPAAALRAFPDGNVRGRASRRLRSLARRISLPR